MSERINHASEARRILSDGQASIVKLRAAHEAGDIGQADDYGKKAVGCWAQANVHATLALVEQQRIANLIAIWSMPNEAKVALLRSSGMSYDEGVAAASAIREGLGL